MSVLYVVQVSHLMDNNGTRSDWFKRSVLAKRMTVQIWSDGTEVKITQYNTVQYKFYLYGSFKTTFIDQSAFQHR